MSATLPDLNQFLENHDNLVFINLIPNPQTYQKHECFKRVNFSFDKNFKEELTPESQIDFFKRKIEERINNSVTDKRLKFLLVMNTIMQSQEVYKSFQAKEADWLKKLKLNVKLLNSTHLSPVKQEIIQDINGIDRLKKIWQKHRELFDVT